MIHDEFSFDINGIISERWPTARFKGGGSDPPSSQVADTEVKRYARQTLYPMVQSGLAGRGFGGGGPTNIRQRSLYGGLEKAYNQATDEFKSQMHRTLDPRDTRVSKYLRNTLERQYITSKDTMARGLRAEKVTDKDLSMSMAADYLGSEKRMTASAAGMYNQALQQNLMNQQRMGTFASNIGAGAGAGAAGFYGANQIDQRYAEQMAP